ncbi:MAG: MoaD/ThiS family protein [Thermoplasmata archaeon]|nr:MAG: MoaD/ThiS family protein [Thermoplasmata archaeon]
MQIKVKYLMTFSQLTGRKSEEVELPEGSTVNDLVEQLIIKYGRKFKKALEKDIEHRSVLFMVNDSNGELSTVLHDNDEVLISYPVGGG